MSFRQFGGLNYATKHNIVSSNYNTSNNLLVTQNVGQPNSYINFLSDISGNIIIYGNLDLSGNLHVSGDIDVDKNVNIIGDLSANYMFLTSGTNYSTSENAVMPKSYIDLVSTGIDPVGQVKAISTKKKGVQTNNTTFPVPLSPTNVSSNFFIDNVTLSAGDAVLLFDQNNTDPNNSLESVYNGVYYYTDVGSGNYQFIRNSNPPSASNILPIGSDAKGAFISVLEGDLYARTGWLQTNTNSVTDVAIVGTDLLVFSEFYNLNFRPGQGLNTSTIVNTTYLNVDSSLNFLTLVDASSSNPTLNIGTENASVINIGSNIITPNVNISGNTKANSNTLITTSGGIPPYPLTGTITGFDLVNPMVLASSAAETANHIEETTLVIVPNENTGSNLFGSYYSGGYLQGTGNAAYGSFGVFNDNSSGVRTPTLNTYFDSTQTCFYKNVGINLGNTGPQYQLDVSGNSNFSGPMIITTNISSNPAGPSLYVQDTSTGNQMLFLLTPGNGTYNPASQAGCQSIIASGTENAETLFLSTHSSTNSAVRISPTSVLMGAGSNTSIPTTSVLCNGTNVVMTGNVGIMTANPQATLDVSGGIISNGIICRDYASNPPLSYLNMASELGVNFIETFGSSLTTGSYAPLYFTNGYAQNLYMSIVPNSSTSGTTAYIGIGKPNPSYTLDVSGNSFFSGPMFIRTNISSSPGTPSLYAEDYSTGNQILFLLTPGNGTYNPASQAGCQSIVAAGTQNAQTLFLSTHSSTNSAVTISPTSVLMGAGGGTSTPTTSVLCNGTNVVITGDTNVNGNGNFTGNVSASSFNTTSDYRIKENIEILNEYHNVDNLRPVTYFNKKTEKQDIGLVAHELEVHFPYLVNGEKDGEELQNVNYSGLIPVLIKEIQELKKEIKLLKAKI